MLRRCLGMPSSLPFRQDWSRWKKRKAQPHVPMSWITIALQCAKLPRRDQRSVDQIIGYDKSGLPT